MSKSPPREFKRLCSGDSSGGISADASAKAIWIFLTTAFSASIALSLFIGFTGGHASRFIVAGYAAMFFPAIAVAITRATIGGGTLGLDWSRLPARYIPAALLLMPAVMHTAMLSLTHEREGHLPWQSWLARGSDGLFHAPESLGWGAMTGGGLAVRLLTNALIGIVIVSVLAFFEEIGWRAWLLPRLVKRFGVRGGIVTTSLIWALWHTPFALSGILHADGLSAFAMAAIHALGTAGAGFILGWLWMRTRSIYVVSLAHGALNDWGQYAFKFMDFDNANDAVPVLAVGSLALLIAGALFVALSRPRELASAA